MSLIKRINETYATMDDVRRLTCYCEHSDNYYNHEYFGTNFLNTEYALKSMERVKRTYHKEAIKDIILFSAFSLEEKWMRI